MIAMPGSATIGRGSRILLNIVQCVGQLSPPLPAKLTSLLVKYYGVIVQKSAYVNASGSLLKRASDFKLENINAPNHISHLHSSVSLPLPLTKKILMGCRRPFRDGEGV